MAYYKKLCGENIYLSPVSLHDGNIYYEWISKDADANRSVFQTYKQECLIHLPYAMTQLAKFAEANAFAIIDASNNKLIGYIGFNEVQSMNQRADLWIKVNPDLDKDKQITLGSEAIKCALEYAYNFLNYNSVLTEVSAFDTFTLDIIKASIMQYMGKRTSSSKYVDNKFYDILYFQMTKEKFATKKQTGFPDISLEGREIILPSGIMRDQIDGNKISLTRFPENIESRDRLISFLSDRELAVPAGEFKENFDILKISEAIKKIEYAIMLDNTLIGFVCLYRKNQFDKTADLGILVGDTDNHGKGYGKEALSLLLDEAFNAGYNSIGSRVFAFNDKSIGLHQSLGFDYVGTREQAYYSNGEFNDIKYYEISNNTIKKR